MLGHVVAPPASGPVLDEPARAVEPWRSGVDPHLVVVLPPCDRNGLDETYAGQSVLATLLAPERPPTRRPSR